MSNKLVSGKQFQSTLPRGERRSLQGILLWFSYFNPHSHEGSDLIISKQITIDTYFNPHSHEGSDLYADINTPPLVYFNPHSHEGSDKQAMQGQYLYYISIHTPTRGATHLNLSTHLAKQFQSTLPRGERRTQMRILKEIDKFQSTLPRGERPAEGRIMLMLSEFQSTLPRGERRWKSLYILLSSDFNPHSHEGSDFSNLYFNS